MEWGTLHRSPSKTQSLCWDACMAGACALRKTPVGRLCLTWLTTHCRSLECTQQLHLCPVSRRKPSSAFQARQMAAKSCAGPPGGGRLKHSLRGSQWDGAAAMLLAVALLLGLYVLLYHNCIKGARCRNETSLRGKTVVVTGGNAGIGKATALDLARRGARVILACRNKVRGESAVYDIRRESGNNEVLFMKLDLASLNSVRLFVDTFLKSEPRLDILINNAGIVHSGRSKDGFGLTFQVNHLSPFLLTQLLLDQLKHCAPSRVLVVASSAHSAGKIDIQNIHKPMDSFLPAFQSYCDSKLASILTVRELANRLKGTNITCYAIDPGFVRSDFFQNFPNWTKPFLFLVSWLFFLDATEGAQTSIYCATQEGIEIYSGRYFANCRLQEPKPHARDDAVAKKLWQFSEKIVGLTAS